jgi:hypothetical protein
MADPIAVYGAATGTVGALGAGFSIYNQWLRDRASLRLSIHRIANANEVGWAINVTNKGRRAVTVSSCPGLELPNGKKIVFTAALGDLPRRLDDGSKITYWMRASALQQHLKSEALMPTHITFEDDGDNSYRQPLSASTLRAISKLTTSI